jgi:glycerol-3-phosphate dehydrogenase (NAD(P)+)
VVFSGREQAALDRLTSAFRTGLAGVGDMFVTCTGGRNVRVGRLLGGGLRFSEARARMGGITLEGAAALQVIGGALPSLTDRGVIGREDFPLLRHLHAVVAHDQSPAMPWGAFFGRQAQAGVVAATGTDKAG